MLQFWQWDWGVWLTEARASGAGADHDHHYGDLPSDAGGPIHVSKGLGPTYRGYGPERALSK